MRQYHVILNTRSEIAVLWVLSSLLVLAGCRPGGLSRDDANGPTGWATCESIQGGHYDLTGGTYCPEKGVQGRKIILTSDGGDMREAIEEAIRRYDIVVLDGSEGPFLYSGTSHFDSLRNKTLVGINGAVLRSVFQCSPALREKLDKAMERFDGIEPDAAGRFRLANDSLVRSFPAYACFQTILEETGDTTLTCLRSGFFHFHNGSENLIIRNLFFDGPGALRGLPNPMISARERSKHIWIDHCTFEDFARLGVSATRQADCITVSWCTFRVTEQSDAHSLGCMFASGDDSWEDEDYLNITFDHCLWQDVWSRVPMARFGTIHVLNNVYDCPRTVGINPRMHSEFLVEGCWFAPGTRPYCDYRTDVAPPKASVFRDNRSDPAFEIKNTGEVTIPYSYSVSAPERSREEVLVHAGPTLSHPLQINYK